MSSQSRLVVQEAMSTNFGGFGDVTELQVNNR